MIDRGTYHVNGLLFGDKIEAILEANKTNADIRWSFHRDVMTSYDWTHDPEISLPDLYALRAQYIRDNYDYVIVMCSGGSDSTNVLHSFIDNGIFIDEVVASAPLSGLSNWHFHDTDTRATNFISEVKFAQLPLMEKVRQKAPKTRMTLNDYFPLLIGVKPDEWMYTQSDGLHPSAIGHFNLELQTHIKKLAEAGKRIAVVYGAEKPFLARRNGSLFLILHDVALNLLQHPFKQHYENVSVIPFYISCDLPQLMIKQAHVVAKWLFRPENSKVLSCVYDSDRDVGLTATQLRKRYSDYDRGIRECIYPESFDPSVFQTDKLSRAFYADIDHWFYALHGHTDQSRAIHAEFEMFAKTIHSKYFNNDRTGFVTLGNEYLIGPESAFR